MWNEELPDQVSLTLSRLALSRLIYIFNAGKLTCVGKKKIII